ncbi:hypothetical protein BJV77DRAFT_990921 [Russula vinacea]|nr:hypothetical protein BJV77DRAFT_990921 [Russula vinacea]
MTPPMPRVRPVRRRGSGIDNPAATQLSYTLTFATSALDSPSSGSSQSSPPGDHRPRTIPPTNYMNTPLSLMPCGSRTSSYVCQSSLSPADFGGPGRGRICGDPWYRWQYGLQPYSSSSSANALQQLVAACAVRMHQHRVVKDMCKPSPHHLNEALKHALYRPAVFFKGIVCSLLDVSGDSWLVGPIIGPTRVFLDKKHALPYKAHCPSSGTGPASALPVLCGAPHAGTGGRAETSCVRIHTHRSHLRLA